MSRNKSFDFVAKQVFDQEGVDIGPLIYRTEDSRVEAVDPIAMSEEYTKLKQEYTDVSANHTAGTSLNDREAKIVDRWNACQDRCALIASEITFNRWYFLREIMTVPENIHTSSDSPFLVDLRTDDSFPLSAWMVKAIWAWERRIPVYCNLVPGMHVEVFLAAMYLYDLFYDSIKYIRYQLDSYRTSKIETISASEEYWSEISFKRIEIVTLMNNCILRIMERYSYLQDICLDVLERLKLLRKSLWSAGYLGETLINRQYMIGTVDEENARVCKPGYDFHRAVPIAPKQSGIIQYCGFLSYKEFHRRIVNYPYLHFNMIMNPEINKFLDDLHTIFRIGINLFEFLDQSRIDAEQVRRLEFLSLNLAEIIKRNQKELKHEIFDLIGIVDESFEEGDHGMDLIQGTDRLMSILREYKKRNPSS